MSNRAKYLLKILISSQSTQQVKKITGKVVDTAGEPIIGANVVVKGSKSIGTITNADGKFSLTVPLRSKLTVSFIGYTSTTVEVGSLNNLTITLQEDANMTMPYKL